MVTYNQYRQMNQGQATQDLSQSLQALLMYLAQREDRKYERERDAKRDEMMMRQFAQSQNQDAFNQLMAQQRQAETVTSRTQSVGIATQDSLQGQVDSYVSEFSKNLDDSMQHTGVRLVETDRPADAQGNPQYDPIALSVDFNGQIANEDQFDPEALGLAVSSQSMVLYERMQTVVDQMMNPTRVREDLLASGMSEEQIASLASTFEDRVRVVIEDAFNNTLAGNSYPARQAREMAAGSMLAMAASDSPQAANTRSLLTFAPNAITPIVGDLSDPVEANNKAIAMAINASYRTPTTADDTIRQIRPQSPDAGLLLEQESPEHAEALGFFVNRLTIGSSEYGDVEKEGYQVGIGWYDNNGKLQTTTLSQEKAVLAASTGDPSQTFGATVLGRTGNFYLAAKGRLRAAVNDPKNSRYHLFVKDMNDDGGDEKNITLSVGMPLGFAEEVKRRFDLGAKEINLDSMPGASRDQMSRAMARLYTGSETADNSWFRKLTKNGVVTTPNNVFAEAGFQERQELIGTPGLHPEDAQILQATQLSKNDVMPVLQRLHESDRERSAGHRTSAGELRQELGRLGSFLNSNTLESQPWRTRFPDEFPEGSDQGIWSVGLTQALSNVTQNTLRSRELESRVLNPQPQPPQDVEYGPPAPPIPAGTRAQRPARRTAPQDSSSRFLQRLGPTATEDPEDMDYWGILQPPNPYSEPAGAELFPPGSAGDINMMLAQQRTEEERQQNYLMAMEQLRQQDIFENAQATQRQIDENVGRQVREALGQSGMSDMADPYSELSQMGFTDAMAAANEQYAAPFGPPPPNQPMGMLPESWRGKTIAPQPQPFQPLADEELFRQEFVQAGNPNGVFGSRWVPTGITSSPNDINTALGGEVPFGPPIPGQVVPLGYQEHVDAVGDAQALFAMSPPDATAGQDLYNRYTQGMTLGMEMDRADNVPLTTDMDFFMSMPQEFRNKFYNEPLPEGYAEDVTRRAEEARLRADFESSGLKDIGMTLQDYIYFQEIEARKAADARVFNKSDTQLYPVRGDY